MELFIPSVFILLLAAAVIFFVLPRFGAATLAIIAVTLLAFGIYQHVSAFGTEYRLSTWQMDIMSYAPYLMLGGVLIVIALYLINLTPFGGSNATAPVMPEVPSITDMPAANTATNAVTAGVNNALKGITNIGSAVGLGNANKGNNGKGILGAATGALNSAISNVTNAVTGNKKNNTGGLVGALGLGNGKPANNKGLKVPGLNFPLSQV